jgi:hypothetical protein
LEGDWEDGISVRPLRVAKSQGTRLAEVDKKSTLVSSVKKVLEVEGEDSGRPTEKITFVIEQRAKKEIELNVAEDETVADVKGRLAEDPGLDEDGDGIVESSITLMFGGKTLVDECVLSRLAVGARRIVVYLKEEYNFLLMTAKGLQRMSSGAFPSPSRR